MSDFKKTEFFKKNIKDIPIHQLPLRSTKESIIYFRQTPKINELIAKIETTYKDIKNIKISNYEIESEVYYSCTAEGAISSVADTIKLNSGEMLPKNDSQKMIKNLLNLYSSNFDNILDSAENLHNAWEIIVKDIVECSNSLFRKKVVVVANPFTNQIYHEGLEYTKIPEWINEYLSWVNTSKLNPLITACVIHFQLVHIHPFSDGNGRLARFLFIDYLSKIFPNIICIPLNYIICKDKMEYSLSLRVNYNDTNITNHIEYMLHVLYLALLSTAYIDKDNSVGETLRESYELGYLDIKNQEVYNYLSDRNLLIEHDYFIELTEDLSKALKFYFYKY